MNSYQHAVNSVEIFGKGTIDQYLPIHQTIDLNKAATNSVYCRFLMHHFDVGSRILEVIYGENVPGTDVPTRHVLLQHLLEDYSYVPMYSDWLNCFDNSLQIKVLPMADLSVVGGFDAVVSGVMKEVSKLSPRHDNTTVGEVRGQVARVFEVVSCKAFSRDDEILTNPNRSWLFASQTGLELVKRILKPVDPRVDDFITLTMFEMFPSQKLQLLSIGDIPARQADWMRRPAGDHMGIDKVREVIKQFSDQSDKAEYLKEKMEGLPRVPYAYAKENGLDVETTDEGAKEGSPTPSHSGPRYSHDPDRCTGGKLD